MDDQQSEPAGAHDAGSGDEGFAAALSDRYRIIRQLGAGGMATVYLADDLKHRRQVAIKVLRPEITALVGPARFLREIEIAASLAHPHILPLHDSGEAAGLLYYVMPYVQGESLRARLTREKQLSVEESLRLTRELADALSHAHGMGIVHRDLKPENVLLEAGHAVLTDFGIAMAVTAAGGARLTETGLAVGTPAYMSPEQAAGDGQVDARTDVYALGCVLYEMLAGEPPFTGPSAVAVLARKSMGAPPRVSAIRDSIPDRVERAIDRALARVPADRFGSVAELAAAVGDGSGPVTVRRPERASKSLAWAGGIAVVLAAALAISLALPRGSPPRAPWSLAVLYFDNLSPDTADAYLADGLTEEVSSRLARIGRLQVKSRQAVRRYRGAEVDLASVARALGVGYLVEGSVRRAGDRVRTSVHLVDAGTGFRVWSDDYDRAASDLLSLQADIAEHVAIQIAGRLLPDEAAALADRPTDDPDAYDRFLRGNYHLTQRSPSAVARAIAEYESALRFDPDFTPALARAAYGYALYLDWGWDYPGLPRDSLLSRGAAASERALARDSASADAWMAHGYMLVHRRPRTLSGAPAAFERALALDPANAEAWHQYGSTLYYLGRDSSAFAALHHALAIEPERPGTWLLVAAMRFQGRRFTEAVRALDSALAHDPSMDLAYALRALARIRLGDRMGALEDARSARRIAEDPLFAETTLGVVEAAFGDTVAARERIKPMSAAALQQDGISVEAGIFLASSLTAIGDWQRALDVLDRVRPRGAHLFMDMRSPDLDPLRGLPRFEQIVAEARPPQ